MRKTEQINGSLETLALVNCDILNDMMKDYSKYDNKLAGYENYNLPLNSNTNLIKMNMSLNVNFDHKK